MGGYRRHNESFFLEEKRSLFYKYESKSKFIQKLHFIDSFTRQMYGSRIAQTAKKLEKMQRRALEWALKKKFCTDSDYNQSLIYNNLLPISFLLVRNDRLMLNRIYHCDTALKFDYYWKVFKGPHSNRSAAKQFLRTKLN